MKEFVIIPGTECQEHFLIRTDCNEVREVAHALDEAPDWDLIEYNKDHRWISPTKTDTGYISVIYVGADRHPQEQYNLLLKALCRFYNY